MIDTSMLSLPQHLRRPDRTEPLQSHRSADWIPPAIEAKVETLIWTSLDGKRSYLVSAVRRNQVAQRKPPF